MDRRAVLRLAGLALVAGCSSEPPRATGPRTPPTPVATESTDGRGSESMSVIGQDVEAADDGHLRVLASVRNPSDRERSGTLTVRVSVDGAATERGREVSVPGNDTLEVTVDFEDVAFDDFSGNGSVQSRLD